MVLCASCVFQGLAWCARPCATCGLQNNGQLPSDSGTWNGSEDSTNQPQPPATGRNVKSSNRNYVKKGGGSE